MHPEVPIPSVLCEYEHVHVQLRVRVYASTVWQFHQLYSTAVPGVFVLCVVGYFYHPTTY